MVALLVGDDVVVQRCDGEREAVAARHAHAAAGRDRRRARDAPALAVHARPAGRGRRERRARVRARADLRRLIGHEPVVEHLADAADDRLRARDDGPPARAQREARHAEHEDRARGRERRDHGPRHAVAGHVGVDQHQRADRERDDAAHAERAERRQERLGDQERDAEQHEREARVADRQQLQREQADEQADRARDARQHEAGIREFEEEPVHAERDEYERDARIGDRREQPAAPVGLERLERRLRGVEPVRARGGDDRAAVELRGEIGRVVREQVDHVLCERVVRGQAHRLAHRALRPFGVAPAQLREAADVSGRVVQRLAGFGRFRIGRTRASGPGRAGRLASPARRRLAADAELHGRRRAEVRAGRHRRHVACIDDIGAGARRACAARRDERGDGHARGDDRLDDLPHRGVEAAGRVELDDRERRVLARGALEAADDEIGARRADRARDRDHDDGARAAAAAAPATAAHASSRPISTAARASRAGSLPRAGGGRGEERGMGIAVSAGGARPHGAAPQPGRGKGVRPVLKE
ncbi:hypothetical protein NCM_02083 [Burkholderia pseudomallei]